MAASLAQSEGAALVEPLAQVGAVRMAPWLLA